MFSDFLLHLPRSGESSSLSDLARVEYILIIRISTP